MCCLTLLTTYLEEVMKRDHKGDRDSKTLSSSHFIVIVRGPWTGGRISTYNSGMGYQVKDKWLCTAKLSSG